MENTLFVNRLTTQPVVNNFDVTLRKGLNIILAKDIGGKGAVNSVGKSTFVRLIDYGLGSNSFLKGETVKSHLSNKFLLMEFSIGDEKYTVKRDLIDGEYCTVYTGWVIDKLKSSNLIEGNQITNEAYKSTLESSLFDGENYFNNERFLTLRQFLPLLIRKQGSGFEKIDDPMGIRENAQLKRQRLQFISNLLSEEEKKLTQDISKKEETERSSKEEYKVIENYVEQKSKEFDFELKVRKGKIEKNISVIEGKLNNSKLQLSQFQQSTESIYEEKRQLLKKINTVEEEITLYESKISNYHATYNEIEKETKSIDITIKALQWFEGYEYKKCPVCLKPFDTHAEKNCGDTHKHKDNVAIETIKKVITNEKEELKDAIRMYELGFNNLSSQHKELKQRLSILDQKLDSNTEFLLSQINLFEETLKNLYKEKYELDTLLEALEDVESYKTKWEENKETVKTLKKQLHELKKKMDAMLEQLKIYFNEVVQYLYNKTKKGVISLSAKAKNIQATILHNDEAQEEDLGDATQIVKVVAFDLALLKLSLTQDLIHPKFLVHDSPNVRDVDPEVYKRIMSYVLTLEEISTDFQYIITTLSIPDDMDENSIFIRCLLDNSGDGGKLFGFSF
ncbi:DNA double-strand break repair Rad50 ATPase (plasmid) [Priestia megaterium]|uniref:DUF2326 domain-containing protein n=1 Tax=Priestia megaterium TaxID=1404 RepID=UPI0015DBD8A8|nr:DUF2326 domain-containing protein [Priestia megaterium]QLK09678.1 DNA double-strand break repair Rad50 ATPase [Priestia megaterium]